MARCASSCRAECRSAGGHNLLHRYLDEFALCDEVGLDIMVNEHHSHVDLSDDLGADGARGIGARDKSGRGFVVRHSDRQPARPGACRRGDGVARRTVGRALEMGLVKGAPYEIAPANSNPADLMRRYWEAHDLILKAMSTTDGPFNWEGEFFHYRNVNVWPRPVQQPTPPVWMTGFERRHRARGGRARPHRRHAIVAVCEAGPDVRGLSPAGARTRLGPPAPTALPMPASSASARRARRARRPANLAADYVRTSPVVAEPFTNPPGYNSLAANVAMLKAGGRRGEFVARPPRQPGRPDTRQRSEQLPRERHLFLPARRTMSTTRSRNCTTASAALAIC